MHKPTIAAALVVLLACAAQAQEPVHRPKLTLAQCGEHCGTVQSVHSVKRKGEGGAVGMIGGALVGGLLGNQVGGGTGKKLATVGGAAAGAYAGNEVQKHATSKTLWVTTVKMRDGTSRQFEQEARPAWIAGTIVRAEGQTLQLP